MAEKPMGVMPICIIAIFLGAMGFFGGLFGLVGLLINAKPETPIGNDPKREQLNAEFQQKMAKFTTETRPVSMALMPILMLTSALLAAAGIAGVQLKGLGFLKLAFASSLFIDSIAAVYNLIVQRKSMEIMKWYFKELPASGAMPPGMDLVMQVSIYAGLFMGIGWLVVKTVYYVVGLIYFSKPKVREAFEPRMANSE